MTRKKSSERGRTVIYGVHPVVETLKAGRRRIDEVYLARGAAIPPVLRSLSADSTLPLTHVSADDMRSLTGSPHHQGVAARVGSFPYVDFESIIEEPAPGRGPIILLDEVQDPVNVGSILRSAECLGAQGVVLTKDRAAPVTPVAEKASAGASAHVPVVRVVNLVRTIGLLKETGFWVYAADSKGGDICYSVDLSGMIALVLGSEGKGLRRLVREECDLAVSIPMVGSIESLSVSQSASILLADCLRRRMELHHETKQSAPSDIR
ncbi:MAG: 23S rRNA (guanosine(2251)-2'-O)-methyltransferase RlmB [Desulfomonilaceae bacterium]|nr:23S rRNA (guanosine(2251)-2'-O)-methyltransferase RlmB [Desulfomonilaceae bacterium]